MKKRTIWRSILVLVLCCSMVLNVFAATTTEIIEHADGSVSEITTTVEVGDNTSSTIVVNLTTSAPDADGNTTVIESVQGEEISDTVAQNPAEVPDITVDLVAGEKTSNAASDTCEETTGDVPEGEDDPEYDYTKTTTTVDREVNASASGTTVTTTTDNADLEAVAPEDYEGKYYDNAEGLLTGMTSDYFIEVEKIPGSGLVLPDQPDAEGYDYQWTGYAEATNAARAESTDVVFAKDADGNPILDENDEYVIESTKLGGKYNDGMYSTPTIFVLTKTNDDGTKEYFYGYCIDNDTEAIPGTWYSVANLEDSDYYPTEESANVLRAIVNNGYWGQESGTGSLSQMRDAIAEYYGETGTVTIKDKNGNPMTFTVAEVLDRFTEADALTATQAAIWSNSNGTLGTLDGRDGTVITGIYSVVKPKSNLANTDRDYDYERDAVLTAAYEYLMSLEGEEAGSVVINDNNFVDDMSLTVGDRVADAAANQDTNKDNDVYNTSLNFKLAFVPGANDDLLVHISYTDLDGNPVNVVKRLAGVLAEGEEYIEADDNGVYVLSGLQLSENSDVAFDLRLEGVQYLDKNVYIYSAYGGAGVSQTMVGIAEGSHTVDVNASMTMTFSVDENAKVHTEHYWATEDDVTVDPNNPNVNPEDPDDEEDPVDPPKGNNQWPDAPNGNIQPDGDLEEIAEEEVPLADVPNTGDASILFTILAILSACGLAVLAVTKKREQN